jgi:hypothetical protein
LYDGAVEFADGNGGTDLDHLAAVVLGLAQLVFQQAVVRLQFQYLAFSVILGSPKVLQLVFDFSDLVLQLGDD